METTVNIPLLHKAVEWVETQALLGEGEWDQRWWYANSECGTTYCVAGFVALAEGWEPAYAWQGVFCTKNGLERRWDVAAREALNISSEDARDLFHETNTVEDVRHIAERIAGERL